LCFETNSKNLPLHSLHRYGRRNNSDKIFSKTFLFDLPRAMLPQRGQACISPFLRASWRIARLRVFAACSELGCVAARTPRSAISDFLADGCMQAGEVAVDFHRVVLDYDLFGYLSN
jgi:hypothetical protein